MSGPCSVESREQLISIASEVKKSGARILRGGAFKPRTSPYSFQGLGVDGLKLLAEAREATGLPVITEIMDTKDLDVIEKYADCLQVGARNMQNFALLKEVGRSKLPVMLKRGMSATIKDLLMSAEYILSEGNFNVLLCERGIRTFETYTRNTLDLNAVPVLKRETHLPVVVDPTHGIGLREHVPPWRWPPWPPARTRSWSRSTIPRNSPRATASRRCCPMNSPTSSARSQSGGSRGPLGVDAQRRTHTLDPVSIAAPRREFDWTGLRGDASVNALWKTTASECRATSRFVRILHSSLLTMSLQGVSALAETCGAPVSAARDLCGGEHQARVHPASHAGSGTAAFYDAWKRKRLIAADSSRAILRGL
jgi:3-deoxy-7-phosphoheptulonate synthase